MLLVETDMDEVHIDEYFCSLNGTNMQYPLLSKTTLAEVSILGRPIIIPNK
jgi:hypothetical protein